MHNGLFDPQGHAYQVVSGIMPLLAQVQGGQSFFLGSEDPFKEGFSQFGEFFFLGLIEGSPYFMQLKVQQVTS